MITKVFKSGNSQAVRIPKKYRIKGNKVIIKKEKNKLIIIPPEEQLDELFKMLENLDEKDFLEDRNQPQIDDREFF